MEKLDQKLFFTFVGLTLFGLVMMSSMSVAGSFEISGRNDYYFLRHLMYIVMGIPVFLLALNFPYKTLKRLSPLAFVFSITLLLLVLIIGQDFGTAAKSWLKVGPLSFQPTEVAKLGVIIFMSAVFSTSGNKVSSFESGLLPFLFILGLPAILIMSQPDFGSLLTMATAAGLLFFAAGANLKFYFGGIIAFLISSTVIIFSNDYIFKRFQIFMNPELDPLGAGFQMKQALIAIGSGGVFGKGFQNSIQKFDYLPEVQSDTIFAAISEEMGFFRILLLIGIYLYIGYRGMRISTLAPDKFTRLLALGMTLLIVGQAFINIGVNLALLPNTGITLPLLSYGGSSLWSSFGAMGILLHISMHTKEPNKRHYSM